MATQRDQDTGDENAQTPADPNMVGSVSPVRVLRSQTFQSPAENAGRREITGEDWTEAVLRNTSKR